MDPKHKGKGIYESMTMDALEFLVNIHIIHGGSFRDINYYIGGKLKVIEDIDWAMFRFHDLEACIESLGYHSGLKYAFRHVGDVERYTFFNDSDSFDNEVSDHIDENNKVLKIYAQCLDDDFTIGPSRNEVSTRRVNLLDYTWPDEEDDEVVTSEYESSNDSPCSLDSDEELGYRRSKRRTNTKIYKSNVDKKSLIFEVGMKFKNYNECKEGIRNWAIENGYNIWWKKSYERKIDARCDGDCPWMLYASKLGHESTFVIKTIMDKHTCVRTSYNRQATSDWLAGILTPILKRIPNYPAKQMMLDVQLRFGLNVNADLCYTAKQKAMILITGSFESQYKMLRSYMSHLQLMDREGKFLLKTSLDEKDQPVFERAYIGFSALRKGFLVGCRRCICFDACFLKTRLGGVLLAAVAKECNKKMWPISWAVVEKESEAAWTWFFEHLFEDLCIDDGFGWTFMSDQHWGIINGIQKLAPNGEHRYCARHIYANWRKQFPGPELKQLFWKAVMCTRESDFKFWINKLKEESNEAYEQFMDREPRKWCKSLISSYTLTDMIENNICETFNSYILRSRDKPIIDMLEEIRQRLMSRMHEVVKKLNDCSDVLCPNVNHKLGKLQELVQYCNIIPAVGNRFEVEVRAFNETTVVDLVTKNCSCRSWTMTGIPCFHAFACIRHNRDDPVRYVDEFYHRATCLVAYEHCLKPIGGSKEWPDVDGPPILPPPFISRPGRPKKNRRRDANEEPRQGKQKLHNKGVRISCTRCKAIGHNVRTCKEAPAQQPQEVGDQPTKKKVGRPWKKPNSSTVTQQNSSTAAHPNSSTTTQQKELRQARNGYGVLTGESGNVYVRPPGARRTQVFTQKYLAYQKETRQANKVEVLTGKIGLSQNQCFQLLDESSQV